jgi:hypothetical protein
MKRYCHKPAEGYATEWYYTAATLPPDWDEQLPEGHFLLRQNLAVHESTGLPDIALCYALLRSKDSIIAWAAFQVLRARPEHVKRDSLPKWQYRAWQTFTTTFRPKLLVGGQLFRHDVASLYWHESLAPYDAFVWYRDTIEAAGRKTGAMAILLKELPAELVPHFLHGAPKYLLLRNDISMQLPILQEWTSIKDYESSLKHKYAQRFRKVRQSWGALRVVEMNADEVGSASGTIYKLYRLVTDNQPVRMGLLSEDFIPALKRAYPEQLKVWGIWEGENMVAFASGWVNEESFDMFYIGFDYARNAALNLYFNILFFAIEQAILLHKPLLILGRTALEAKARVGCRPQYLNTFLYIRNPVLREIIARMQARLVDTSNEWEQRHPFKS